MDFSWEALTEEEQRQAYADWEAGKGLIGGDPRRRPNAHLLPDWGLNEPFYRTLTLDDTRSSAGARLRADLAGVQPLEIEIGFGRGDFLLDRASRFRERIFIGYESKTKATRLFLPRLRRRALANVWVSDDDCRFNLSRVIPDGRVALFHILFPDPWWKPQHRIRRLFSPPFVDLLANKLAPGGLLHFKSDVQEYGELVRYLVERHADFCEHDPNLADRIGAYVPTHREQWCHLHERPVYVYYFVRR